MPSTIIANSAKVGGTAVKAAATSFTGDVWVDFIHASSEVNILNVTFLPCARTHWHTHEKGQVLKVIQGSGWICDRGGEPRRIKTGDLIHATAGTEHWHGAEKGTILTHLALGFGKTEWLGPVTDEEYEIKD